ncbi:hypothetical protein SAMN05421858_2148 [Haladaptatus litoreus]|uniref:Uncharacterized protein n=1 Tax=Haladaptatus litoreus TaxID=553468 RepID=A0A1N6ZSY0_9EURY|nr:hypothetical protein SAMN05421858_2148 [Haladaptatus litoreus]
MGGQTTGLPAPWLGRGKSKIFSAAKDAVFRRRGLRLVLVTDSSTDFSKLNFHPKPPVSTSQKSVSRKGYKEMALLNLLEFNKYGVLKSESVFILLINHEISDICANLTLSVRCLLAMK